MNTAVHSTLHTGVRRPNGPLVMLVLAVCLLAAIVLSFGIGPLKVSPADVLRIVFARFGLADAEGLSARDIAVVWNLRIPRALMGALVGASLALAGAGLQGLFGNPLADPGVVGVSQGAALGAVAAIVLGATALGDWTVPVAAFIGGIVSTTLIYLLARPGHGNGTVTLLLVGIAIGAACSAAIGFFTYRANSTQLQSLVFWQMGSLGSADWSDLGAALPVFLVGLVGMLVLATPLDMLALGERQAQHIGLDVKRTRALLVTFSALLVGAAVAFAGTIGFVGLVIPHIVRLLAGPRHRWLLPLSALAGATLIVVADTAARTLDPPSEIPLGLFSAAIGAPFFLWLVLRLRPGGAR
ncbi:iron ABC transporter permease [Hydrogenophaga sp.]|uniref:FecCD family ABC transporter permease n=1 Tax=Hydrogenophaga sp. TaxID=1904254 RepID=UPI002715853E|nr:iron ABC transporter permease [Hydrogenophaga sp.]MDO9436929.1 iron ABC transporter permease [Hydrogenophaga sp.]